MAFKQNLHFDAKRTLLYLVDSLRSKTRSITPVAATKILSCVIALAFLLPLPWFRLEDAEKSVAGTRLLSYAFDDIYISYLLSLAPAHTILFFALPIAITLLSFMTLLDAFMNNARNAQRLSLCNIIAMLILMYAAIAVADQARHATLGGIIILPKWGLWLILLSTIGIITLSIIDGLSKKRLSQQTQST